MQAIAAAGTTIDATTQLSVASVTATGDLQGRDVVATQELHADGAAIFNSTLAVAGNTTIGGTLLVNNVNVVSAINGKQDTLSSVWRRRPPAARAWLRHRGLAGRRWPSHWQPRAG